MASTVLPNGIIIPEKFSRDWYADLYHNWQELDNLLGGGTPKDGTLTIQKNGDTVGTFSANQATDETINITVPDVNNATLTIQKNGTTVDTFTANSSTDKTVDITVPTKTSDLTNDSGFITEDNTKIPLAGSNAISGDLIPSTDGTVNLGGSSYQWNNLYAKSYYYNGTQWGLDQANVWNTYQTIRGYYIGKEQSTNGRTCLYLTSNRDTVGQSGIYITKFRQNRGQGGLQPLDLHYLAIDVLENSVRTNSVLQLNVTNWNDEGIPNGVIMFSSLSNAQLGSSLAPWKTLNGINPGALSLPSGTVGMNLIGDVAVVGAEKKLSKDITVTGFVYVDVSFSSTSSNRLNLYNNTKKYGIWIPCNSGRIRQIMPISAGDRLEFNVLDDGTTINAIQLFACQGNV